MSSEVPNLSEEQFLKCLIQAQCHGTSVMTYESGPYGVMRMSIAAENLCRLIEQAVRAQWAAEVARITEIDAVALCNFKAARDAAIAERDSAQAEAKRLREALTDFVNKSHRLPIGPERDAMYQRGRAALQSGEQA